MSCVHASPINRDIRLADELDHPTRSICLLQKNRTSEDQLRENVDLTSRATKYSMLKIKIYLA